MIKTIGTHIKVQNFRRSLEFYTNLGFQRVFEYGPDKEVQESYSGAVFEQGGCKLEIADGHRAVKPEVFKQKVTSSKISLMIQVDDMEDILEKCQKHAIQVAVRPRHYYWGTLEMVVKDPDGTVLVFIAPYDSKVANRIGADETWAVPH